MGEDVEEDDHLCPAEAAAALELEGGEVLEEQLGGGLGERHLGLVPAEEDVVGVEGGRGLQEVAQREDVQPGAGAGGLHDEGEWRHRNRADGFKRS